jgi:hypothetical protein
MKKGIALVFILLTQIVAAQVTRDLGDFDEVKVFDKLNVKLIASTENKIVITGNRENEVEVVTKNGELKLRMPFPQLLAGEDISIELYYINLEGIEASEGSHVSSDATFKQTQININAKSGAEISVDLDVAKASIRAVSGGIINLSGIAINQDVTITSGGILNAEELHTSQTSVTVSAGGSADVYATLLVDAKVNAGGSINIYGKPKHINQKTVIGGTITEK